MIIRYRSIYLLLFLCSLLVVNTGAQDDNITPTPAPSKTPTASPAIVETTPEVEDSSNPVPQTVFMEPFTQEDLTVLTGNVQRPNGITWFDGKLYTACNGDWTLYELDDTTGATITFVFGLRNLHTMYIEPTDAGFDIWAPDFDTNGLYRVNQNRSAPVVITDQLDSPWGIAYLDADTFLVTSLKNGRVDAVTRSGGVTPFKEGFRSPTGLVVDNEAGVVYVANNGSARRAVEWFSLDAVDDTEPQPLISGLQNVTNMVLAEDGNLYMAYSLGNRGVVGRVDPDFCREAGCTTEQAEIVLFTELAAPLAGMVITPDMRLFVHTIYRPELYWVQLDTPDTDE